MTFMLKVWRILSFAIQIVPFFKCVCVYGVVEATSYGKGSIWVALAKSLPVISLTGMVLLNRFCKHYEDRYRYGTWVGIGLVFSAVGDVVLVSDGALSLAVGMACFGAAHLAYIAAFGLQPRRTNLATFLFAVTAVYTSILTPPPLFRLLVPVYAFLLATMTWRGVARVHRGISGLCSAAGSLLFLASDGVLAYSMFNGPVPHKQVLVMGLYYMGQLGIALSATLPNRNEITAVDHASRLDY